MKESWIIKIFKGLGHFGVVDYPVSDCEKTFVTKILEIPNKVSILVTRIDKGGFVPKHTHNNLTVMIPIAGRARSTGFNSCDVEVGSVLSVPGEESHGFSKISEDFVFISVCVGGRIISNESNNKEEDFMLAGELEGIEKIEC